MAGWPTFDEDNRYQGPFNRQKINSEMLIGRNKEVFQSAATAVWPAALCEVLARNLVAELWKTASTSKAQEKGESRGRERRRIVGTSNEEEGNEDDRGNCKKVVGDRRKISSEELAKVKFGEALDGSLVCVGEFDLRRARLEIGWRQAGWRFSRRKSGGTWTTQMS